MCEMRLVSCRLELTDLASQWIAIDPVHHVAAVTAASANGVLNVYAGHVFEVFDTVDEILIGQATPRTVNTFLK